MDSIGGYRIVRRLASGGRADVLLGHAGAETGSGQRLAAIKVLHSHVPDASVDAEIGALSRLDHPHIVRLLDLATGPQNEPILILERLEPGGLARLLSDRGSLGAGEAVTILAPLVSAVGAMHRVGVTHGRISPSAVLFDDRGAPKLCGFGSAGAVPARSGALPPATLDQDPGVLADIDGMTALATVVLGRVPDSAAHELRQWLAKQQPATELLARLEERLFAFAEPSAVNFDPEDQSRSIPGRFELGAAGTPARAVAAKAPEWLASALGRIRAVAGSVRRRVWMVASIGGAAAAISVAMVLAPSGDSRGSKRPLPTATALVNPSEPSVVMGDDPVAAAELLLELRARCLLERSVVCLDAVHQPASAAWQADAARIQDIESGAELAGDSFGSEQSVTFIDRMGDSALVGLQTAGLPAENATASVLMIRTEAGWRFRSLLEGTVPPGG